VLTRTTRDLAPVYAELDPCSNPTVERRLLLRKQRRYCSCVLCYRCYNEPQWCCHKTACPGFDCIHVQT